MLCCDCKTKIELFFFSQKNGSFNTADSVHIDTTAMHWVLVIHFGGEKCYSLKNILCVSCPSATEFSAILFLLFARSSSNSPRSFQSFRRNLRQNFNWIRQRINNFPIDPHCKNWPLSAML